jgi:hypothetical protein
MSNLKKHPFGYLEVLSAQCLLSYLIIKKFENQSYGFWSHPMPWVKKQIAHYIWQSIIMDNLKQLEHN